MKKFLACALVLGCLSSVVPAQTVVEKDKALASVNLTKTETINRNLFLKLVATMEKQAKRSLTAAEKFAQLQKQITAIVLSQQAEVDRITLSKEEMPTDLKSPLYVSAAAESGLTAKEVQDAVRLQLLSTKYLQAKQAELSRPEELDRIERELKLGNKDYEAAYKQNMTGFLRPVIIQFNYITIETSNKTDNEKKAARQTMDDLAKQIKAGGAKAFDELMKKSKDSIVYSGGESPYIREDTPMTAPKDKDFMSAVFALKKGDISPVIEKNTSLIIVLITDRRDPVLVGIDDLIMPGQKMTPRTYIRQTLLLQKGVEKTIESLLGKWDQQGKILVPGKAEIKIFEQNFNW